MRPGGGHAKGAQWERQVCTLLSLWISKGKLEDCFWRSSMSGGRSTVHRKRGRKTADAACGDICATRPIGHRFTDRFFIECKSTATLDTDAYLDRDLKGKKEDHWLKPCRQAKEHGKVPFVILKRNRMKPMVFVQYGTREQFNKWGGVYGRVPRPIGTFPLYRIVAYSLADLLTALDPSFLKSLK